MTVLTAGTCWVFASAIVTVLVVALPTGAVLPAEPDDGDVTLRNAGEHLLHGNVLAELRALRAELSSVKAENAALRSEFHDFKQLLLNQTLPGAEDAPPPLPPPAHLPQFNHTVDVRSFGADCNGNASIDDAPAIQAAINSFPKNHWACDGKANSTGCSPDHAGGVLLIPGVCYIKTALVVDRRSLLLRGVGRSVSGFRALGPFEPATTGRRAILTIYSVDTALIADLTVDGMFEADIGIDLVTTLLPSPEPTGRSIDVNMERLQITQTTDGIRCPEIGQVSELTFVDLWLSHNKRSCFSCVNGAVTNVRWIGGQFESYEKPVTNETACYADPFTGELYSCIFDLRGGTFYFFDPFLALQATEGHGGSVGFYKDRSRLHVFGGGTEVHPWPNITHSKIIDTAPRHNMIGTGGELSMHGFIASGWGGGGFDPEGHMATGNDQVSIRLQQASQVMLTSCDFQWGTVQWSPPPYVGEKSLKHPGGETETKASLILIGSRMLNELRTPGDNASSVVRLGAGQTGPQAGGLWPNDATQAASPFFQLGNVTMISQWNTARHKLELCAKFSSSGSPVCFASETDEVGL